MSGMPHCPKCGAAWRDNDAVPSPNARCPKCGATWTGEERGPAPTAQCPECGATWREGSTCETYFHQLLFWEAEQPSLGAVHHLMVLCYHLQHPSLYSPQGLYEAQELLARFIDHGTTPQQAIQQSRQQVDSRRRTWKVTATPEAKGSYVRPPRWALTIADVVAAGPVAYVETVRQWAGATRKTLL